MLDLNQNDGPKPKCLVSNTRLSNFLNHEQPPTKKRPFSTILKQDFSHNLDLLLPSQAAQTLQDQLSKSGHETLHYAKLHIKLSELITGSFFTECIKSPPSTNGGPDLLMLSISESNPYGNLYLCSGILHLELDKPTLERTGLEGKVIRSEGRKHVKDRFAIEINLRLPSMVKGKKGFDRILWAFENVLSETFTWLVCDAKGGALDGVKALEEFAPLKRKAEASEAKMGGILVPTLPKDVKEEYDAEVEEVLEWLSLAMLDSPRVQKDDTIDAYFSRYQVPDRANAQDLVRLRWEGLIPPGFAYMLFISALKAAGGDWLAMNATAFDGEAYMVLVHDGQSVTWEYKD